MKDPPGIAREPAPTVPEDGRVGAHPLRNSVTLLKGVGPARAAILEGAGIRTWKDVLLHLPARYRVRPAPGPVSSLREGECGVAAGRVKRVHASGRGRKRNLRVLVEGAGGAVELVLFGAGYRKGAFPKGRTVAFMGRITRREGRLQCLGPDFHVEGDPGPGFPGILPLYTLPRGMPRRTFLRMVDAVLGRVNEQTFQERARAPGAATAEPLMPLPRAVRAVHRPASLEEAEAARRRLAFEEFFAFQMGLARRRAARRRGPGPVPATPYPLEEADRIYRDVLPFPLTTAQARAVAEIRADLADPRRPMHRLLQGDVGSGKTIVALYPLLAAACSGGQGALMAPTEVLAGQHFRTLRELVGPAGWPLVFLHAGLPSQEARRLLDGARPGIVVGTHALIQERIAFPDLRACVVDEQHKFGVAQRFRLKCKGRDPEVLVMTATPIPRSLALTLYGELDVSVIDSLPPGRGPVETRVVQDLEDPRLQTRLEEEIASGGRAFFVCPLVHESRKVALQAAVTLADRLGTAFAGRAEVGLLHGSMVREEKERILSAFREGTVPLLVTTVVVEVGVDVPEAGLVVVLDAWRFGLAQLHQIRGRVGRGGRGGCCFLVGEAGSAGGRERLAILEKESDGFRIAEADLRMRGPGEALGLRQHGLPPFRVGDGLADVDLMAAARDAARRFLREGGRPDGLDLLFPLMERSRPWIG